MFGWFRKKTIFDTAQLQQLKKAVELAEVATSGELRLFIEKSCKKSNSLERVQELFVKHKMNQTQQRNGILIYVAFENKQIAIWGDEGINAKIDPDFWQKNIDQCLFFFKQQQYVEGLSKIIFEVGEALKKYFPYDSQTDKNELSDEILLGKM